MTTSAATVVSHSAKLPAAGRFVERRLAADRVIIRTFRSKAGERLLRRQSRTDLDELWDWISRTMDEPPQLGRADSIGLLDIHRVLVEGLPGLAMYMASAMSFNTMAEALPFFGVSAKTARARLGEKLSSSESELALRIGRTLELARQVFGSADAARQYLRTPNYALGGAIPRDLLKTAEGEQIVLGELQTQAEGGPV